VGLRKLSESLEIGFMGKNRRSTKFNTKPMGKILTELINVFLKNLNSLFTLTFSNFQKVSLEFCSCSQICKKRKSVGMQNWDFWRFFLKIVCQGVDFPFMRIGEKRA